MDTVNFALVLILSASMLLLCISVYLLYYFHKREKEFAQKEEVNQKKAEAMFEHVHNRVRSILEKTVEKADRMLLETEYLNYHIKKDVQDTLDKILDSNAKLLETNSRDFFESYHKELQSVKQEYFKSVENIITQIKQETEAELRDFISIIVKETVEAQGFMSKKINNEFEKAQIEIKSYKAQQLQKIDESVNRMILKVTEDVVGKMIPLSDHQSLILKSLEEAEKEGMFAL